MAVKALQLLPLGLLVSFQVCKYTNMESADNESQLQIHMEGQDTLQNVTSDSKNVWFQFSS